MTTQTAERTVSFPGMELRFRVDETDGRGEIVLFEWDIQPAAKVPAPHFHESADEVLYGLGGTLTTTVDGVVHEVRKGDVVFVPRGAVHHHANVHDEVAQALVVLAPGTIGRTYFEEMAAELSKPGPPDMPTLLAIMERHGLVPA